LEADAVSHISPARVNGVGNAGNSYLEQCLGSEGDSGEPCSGSAHVDADQPSLLPSFAIQDFHGPPTSPAIAFDNVHAHTTTPRDLNVRLGETYTSAPLQTVAHLHNADSVTASNSTLGNCDPVARGILSLSELSILLDM
jgi:hypothetical protein